MFLFMFYIYKLKNNVNEKIKINYIEVSRKIL